jgi:proteasome assembly chaperone 4
LNGAKKKKKNPKLLWLIMAGGESDVDAMNEALSSAQIFKDKQQQPGLNPKDHEQEQNGGGVQITCFSDVFNEVTLHFQILRLPKQVHFLKN